MFGKYEDFIIIVLILGLIVLAVIVICLKLENSKLKDTKAVQAKQIIALQFTVNRMFRVVESNADSVSLLRKQMNQVHQWLGEVLSISNLIRNEEGQKDSSIVIEELRELVKWAKVKGKRAVNENDYYKGD
ncbi:hypothetical protein [Microcoleus sp. B3-D7]|uniref:hypothetical protein n=1 Tax=Microcoleus sp. B3-D7 TaxID=2818659 RepID=UPI002FD0613B